MTKTTRYPVPAEVCRFTEEIQRSRFITTLAPANTVDEARAFIDEIRVEFPDATHNCWAFLVGPPGSSGHVGMSDNGEPHGTAGRPMLNVLSHARVGDIAAVVTRYFGGTKLGKGGLVRAYSGGVQKALEHLPVTEKMNVRSVRVVITYSDVASLRRLAGDTQSMITGEKYQADASFILEVPEDAVSRFAEELQNLTNGKALMEITENDQ